MKARNRRRLKGWSPISADRRGSLRQRNGPFFRIGRPKAGPTNRFADAYLWVAGRRWLRPRGLCPSPTSSSLTAGDRHLVGCQLETWLLDGRLHWYPPEWRHTPRGRPDRASVHLPFQSDCELVRCPQSGKNNPVQGGYANEQRHTSQSIGRNRRRDSRRHSAV